VNEVQTPSPLVLSSAARLVGSMKHVFRAFRL
jgi:hypothetical protein